MRIREAEAADSLGTYLVQMISGARLACMEINITKKIHGSRHPKRFYPGESE